MESREKQIKREMGERLRFLRNSEGSTQETVAMALGCTADHLSRIENGERGPSFGILLEAGEYYHVSIDWILTGCHVSDSFSRQLIKIADELKMLAKGQETMNVENDK